MGTGVAMACACISKRPIPSISDEASSADTGAGRLPLVACTKAGFLPALLSSPGKAA
jgi:hypothetical protein